jgi:ABC-type polysaccharide/polyol phosphate transport system ATPase subunit
MSDLALECTEVTKLYRLGATLSLQQTLAHLKPGKRAPVARFAALDAVSFSVARGSFFGIVGSNGSGKSTLTQAISGITVPTSGTIRVWGRVLPLLEVGAGFHDELTGRENVRLLGAILGVPGRQVTGSINDILNFADVHRHFDTPLKRYSTGMKARLSFATAICFPSEIYVFDEVLAVVDDDFRDHCIAELQKLNALGRTIIFMSHDLSLVTGICREGMWLEKGIVRKVGAMHDVAAAYAQAMPESESVGASSQEHYVA